MENKFYVFWVLTVLYFTLGILGIIVLIVRSCVPDLPLFRNILARMKKKKIKPKEENKSTPDVVEKPPPPPPVIERPVQVPIHEEEKPLISQQPSARTWRGKKSRGDD